MVPLGSVVDKSSSLLSASASSEMERILRISVRLWMVVEQLICPPKKNATLPSESNNGAELAD